MAQWPIAGGVVVAAAGRPLPDVFDSLLARDRPWNTYLVLVTRNTKDFAGLPVEVFNPWTS